MMRTSFLGVVCRVADTAGKSSMIRGLSSESNLGSALPSAEAMKRAELRDKEYRKHHFEFKEEYSDEVHRKKLIYRSKQRGWLEVDLLLGTWATENVPRLTTEELRDYEKVMNLETIEIFNVLSKPENEIPENLKSSTLTRLRAYAADSPFKLVNKNSPSKNNK